MSEQYFNRNKTAIIIMDYQNRQLSSIPEPSKEKILQNANMVLSKARQANIPIIHIEVIRGERGWETEIHPKVKPIAGELLLTKSRVGPFSTTDLDNILKTKGIDTIVLMGVATGGCVLTAVRWAADIDYKILVLSDCCDDPDTEIHTFLMEKVFPRRNMAKVMTGEEFIKAID
jgi:nicotinamidase-related amidase